MRVKFSQTYKKNNFFIWGRLFSSSSLTQTFLSVFYVVQTRMSVLRDLNFGKYSVKKLVT